MAEIVIICPGDRESMVVSLHEASQLKGGGADVAVFFEWGALIAFAERKFEFSPSVARYAATMEENAKKMGLATDPMDNLKTAKAAGIPTYGCAVEAALLGIREKVPPEIQLMELPDSTKLLAEAKKVIGGF